MDMNTNKQVATGRQYLIPILAVALFTTLLSCSRKGLQQQPGGIPTQTMIDIYKQVQTPYKYGIVLKPDSSNVWYDSPTVFRDNDKWYMTYIAFDGTGYDTWLAESADLLHWTRKGRIMTKDKDTTIWDNAQRAGYVSLVNMKFGGDYTVSQFDSSYWASYIGGASAGYEKGALSIGLARFRQLTDTVEWNRLPKPVLTPYSAKARSFENKALYKSSIVYDSLKTTGFPYLMFYNGEAASGAGESITMAGSHDMLSWNRLGQHPLISHKKGIFGDAQVVRLDNMYVMFYFCYTSHPGTFDFFACSRDLYHWTEWTGTPLIASSEPYDRSFAHKPWVVKYNGVVYHFYDAIGASGRVIAVATSEDMGKSPLN